MSLKSQLSHLMPVAQACSTLGEDRVSRIVTCLLRLTLANNPNNADVTADASLNALNLDLQQDVSTLVQAMFYTTNSGANKIRCIPQHQSATLNIPPPIRDAWKKLQSRPLLLDKMTLIKFLVPACSQPHGGPGGHMGLFDCLTYALQTKPSVGPGGGTAPATSPSSPALPQLVGIPDICIFLAICQNYWDLQQEETDDAIVSFPSDHPVILFMSQWMFWVYDAYQKKGVVARDTFHRFLSDVHGEDSYKTLAMRELLDKVFSKSQTLTQREFVQAISDTLTYLPQPSHVLLDWMANLAQAIMPIAVTPESTQVFLQTIDQELRWLPQICDQYQLAEQRLYEIKRRFHSLVETTTSVIQGDPMSVEQQSSSGNTTGNNSSSNTSNSSNHLPKHVIPPAVFFQAVCSSNDERGHGGHLPRTIAQAVFEGVSSMASSTVEPAPGFWDLTHVLQFGGLCVRCDDKDEQLIKWVLEFLFGNGKGTKHLIKAQVGNLLHMLCQHMDFRLGADKPAMERADDTERSDDSDNPESETNMVSVETARLLGLLPDPFEKTKETQISADVLVKQLLRSVESTDDTLTLEQLLAWHRATKQKDKQRLGPFITELRLIASVMFGVPPKLASMEHSIITEIQRRHKERYPRTDVSRRGPRGTVWYVIDDLWYRTWNGMIQKVSFTEEDGRDLRDKASDNASPRRFGKISNRGLLRDNGSLALKVDIKWRHDYEIVPPLAWSALQAWYDGGPPIHRMVVPYVPANPSSSPHRSSKPSIRTENEIELYPFFVTMFLCDAPSRGEARPFQQQVPLSRVSAVRVLLVQLCKGLDVDPNLGRLWVMESATGDTTAPGNQGDWLLYVEKNIVEQRKNRVGDQGGCSTITLLLELKDEESGLWPRGEDGKTWSFNKTDSDTVDTGDGVVGLYNMGNTCYLNSSIQCLSHTPIFRDYFTDKCYLNDINTTNPLGYQGHLAQVSAVLINSLWKRFNQQAPHQSKRVTAPGSYAPVSAPALTPKTFKESLGKFNEQFAGNEQHDAQEMLAFLLGGLSEDLNRIMEKPYIQAPDSDGRPDSELADIWWSNHLKREMSIIVALFTGQYKSLLRCKTCKYESARFEPFSFLQLPLPEDDTIPINLILYPKLEGVGALKYSVRVHNNGTLYDVLISLAKVLHADEQQDGKEESPSLPEPETEDQKERLDAICKKLAQNMSVVDMREGYIFKIAPNAWRLPDLQNKDTGELPLLHVYALDPMPEGVEPNVTEKKANKTKKEDSTFQEGEKKEENGEEATTGHDDSSTDSKDESLPARYSFLAMSQRRSELLSKEVLHPLTHRVFGTPILLRVVDMKGLAGSKLYDLVATRLRNFVPQSALKFLQGNSDKDLEQKEAVGEEVDLTKAETRQRLQKTTTDMEEVASGPVPRYGFRLRIASRDGRRCALCPWYDCCIGCLVPDTDSQTVVMCGDSIVIDWHFAVDVATNGFGTRGNKVEHTSQQSQLRGRVPGGVSVKNHSSCVMGKKNGHAGAITLEDCLDAFAKEEKIPEAYCSQCKDFRVQTKRMSLWRLPPVVIIHLKRFQFTQHMRRKLRDFVHFPLEGLDLSRIMATDSASSGQRDEKSSPKKSEVESKSSENLSEDKKTDGEADEEKPTVNGKAESGEEEAATVVTEDDSSAGSPMNQDDGRTEMLYDLYGVVHHQGALSGGHYVASLKSETDGQWRLFNDAQIYEIHSRDVVDSSAYILFYIRRDVKNLNLEDFWNTSHRQGGGLTEEEMDKLIRGRSDRCVIS